MKTPSYVLVTPVRNEEATIEITIQSVMKQTLPPKEWVIVSDQSTDRTDGIIRAYASRKPFIRLLRLEDRPTRGFGSVVFATEAGIAALQSKEYDFLGLLDGDIRLEERYYEELLRRFAQEPQLGLAGGLATDVCNGRRRRHQQALSEVAGAVQLFRRECFEALGGLVALPEGGWDAITCVQARMQGFKTRTFPDMEVDHLKPRNVAEGGLLRRYRQLGVREYALGNHPLFEVVKCGYRCIEYPFVIGALCRLVGYAGCYLRRRKRMLPPEVVRFIRREQLGRLLPFGRASATRVRRGPAKSPLTVLPER